MKTVMRAVDRAVRGMREVNVIGWQRRQDSFHGEDVFAETPTD
jgi:S-adenosylmethionine hydrolase